MLELFLNAQMATENKEPFAIKIARKATKEYWACAGLNVPQVIATLELCACINVNHGKLGLRNHML